MLWILHGSKETIQGVCLLCLCVGIMSLIFHHKEVPKFCAKAKKCTPCVHQSCADKDKFYRDMFRIMCCGSEAANKTQECRQLCENSSRINAVRYNSKTNKSEDLCPANEILKECEKGYCSNCTETMCSHFVHSQIFLQQCLPYLKYQLFSEECKNLANQNSRSITSSTKSLNETTNSTKDPPDKVLINSAGTTNTTVSTDDVKSETTTPANPATTQHVTIIVGIVVPVVVIVIAVLALVCCCRRPCYTNSKKSSTEVYKVGVPEEVEEVESSPLQKGG
ncbi:uncharacterized protein LOC128210405 isoform X1 [Mya arenaria]|uniref:uncharacterized protein LOC128210405 isoform X1 n=1 Tax=Mya arenaria TaxID=6604 RepID=UPI0022DF82E6|nr:uncharacterized protein LOC128210405 isoform X1 [Mya arenaria]